MAVRSRVPISTCRQPQQQAWNVAQQLQLVKRALAGGMVGGTEKLSGSHVRRLSLERAERSEQRERVGVARR